MVGDTSRSRRKIHSARYLEILEQNSWPVVEKGFFWEALDLSRWRLSNAQFRFTMQWKRQNITPYMMWPSPRQDINTMENIWRMLKVDLNRRVQDVDPRADLLRVLKEIWASLSPAYIHSLPSRIRHVYEAN